MTKTEKEKIQTRIDKLRDLYDDAIDKADDISFEMKELCDILRGSKIEVDHHYTYDEKSKKWIKGKEVEWVQI